MMYQTKVNHFRNLKSTKHLDSSFFLLSLFFPLINHSPTPFSLMALVSLQLDESESVSHSVLDSLQIHGLQPSGSSVHGILQVRILEWVVMPFSRDLPNQGSNLGLLHCRHILHYLSYQETQKNKLTLLMLDVEMAGIEPGASYM